MKDKQNKNETRTLGAVNFMGLHDTLQSSFSLLLNTNLLCKVHTAFLSLGTS